MLECFKRTGRKPWWKIFNNYGAENLETEGGYAKEASDDFLKKQEELLAETLKKIDIVICTALMEPGKKSPAYN